MQNPMRKLMLISGALSLLLLNAGCATRGAVISDSYCAIYDPIIQKAGDGQITAAAGVKRRILYNEQMFRNECRKRTAK